MNRFWSVLILLAFVVSLAVPAQAQVSSSADDGWVLLPQVIGGTVGTFGGLVAGIIGGGIAGATMCGEMPSGNSDIETFRDIVRVGKCLYSVLTSTLAGMAIGMPVGAALGVSLATPSDFGQTYLGSFIGAFAGEMLGLGAVFVVPSLLDMNWIDTIRHGDKFVGFTLMATIAGSIIGSHIK